jgi:hypothetical protein
VSANEQVIYAGTLSSSLSLHLYVTTTGASGTWVQSTLPGAAPSAFPILSFRISIDPSVPGGSTAYAVTGNSVCKTTNSGQSWTDISGNLPKLPVFSVAVSLDGNVDAEARRRHACEHHHSRPHQGLGGRRRRQRQDHRYQHRRHRGGCLGQRLRRRRVWRAAVPASFWTCRAAPSSIIFSSLPMARNCQPSAIR